MSQPVVSVILPTYNEAENVPIIVEKTATALAQIPYEIIIVDDNSPDRTWQVAQRIAEQDPHVHMIRRLNERGLSSAVITGMNAARGQCLAVMDSDMQHDEAALPDLVHAIMIENYDIAIGSRGVEGGSYGDFSRKRRFISWVAASMARIILPMHVRDPMSGYFVVAREIFQECVERINPVGFKILLEFIGRNPEAKVKEVGYKFRRRIHGETKLSGSVIKNYLVALWDMRFGRFISSTFLLYSLVGSFGVLVNLGGLFLGEYLGLPEIKTGWPVIGTFVLSVALGIELSIISNYIMNNWVTFFDVRHRGFKANARAILLFHLISSLAGLVQLGVFQLLYENGFLSEYLEGRLLKAVLDSIGILVALTTNYYLNINFTWQKKS